jgi:GNAT superfamily N-acetyltransferase
MTANVPMLRTEPANPAHASALGALFDAAGCPCHCRYWHFEGDKNAWLERCALAPEQNQAEQAAALAAGTDDAAGIVALVGDDIVGWLKLAPRAALGKLLRLGAYRPLGLAQDPGVLGIGCVLVHPAHRARGVARALIVGAVEHGARVGAHTIEAYPLRAQERLRDDELGRGPEALYRSLGFTAMAAPVLAGAAHAMFGAEPTGAYPVLRRPLSPVRDKP